MNVKCRVRTKYGWGIVLGLVIGVYLLVNLVVLSSLPGKGVCDPDQIHGAQAP